MRSFLFGLGLAAALTSTPVCAAWHKASSPHFIIYADKDPVGLKAFADKLERFDAAVRLARGMKDPPVGDGNRLTIFVVRSINDVHKLQRGTHKSTAGFYMPRGSGSVAVVPDSAGTKHDIDPEVVFFHEYAHHLMFSDLETPTPAWLVEGFAEFYSTANIEKDGSVGLGEAAVHRKGSLRWIREPVSIAEMMSGTPVPSGPSRASFYGRSWLLTHYLTFSPNRGGQVEKYLDEIARGRDLLEAARLAFGDLGQLERDLDQYLRDEKFPYLTIPAGQVKSAAAKIEALGPGAEAALPLFIRLNARAEGDPADMAAQARALAAAHPADQLVAMAEAEAEWVARNYRASQAAADRAIRLMPQSAEAHIWKGRALLSRARAREPGVSFADARSWFSMANKLDPENPEPLHYFYLTYRMAGAEPTANAIAALHYSAALAPHDMGLRLQSAREYLRAGNVRLAKRQLVPVAYNPHGGRAADTAREMLQLVEARDTAAAQVLVKDED